MRGKRAKELRREADYILQTWNQGRAYPEVEYEQVKTGRYTIDIDTGALKEQTITKLTLACSRYYYQQLKKEHEQNRTN
jgi:hypothetical protein